MRIRPAAAADVGALFEVRTAVRENHLSMEQLAVLGITPASVAEMIAGDSARAWVGEVDGRVVAFSIADAAEATVWAMFVRPGHEGRGLGRALMREAEAWLFSRGLDEIWLLTDADRGVRANGFYRHLGWTDAGVQPDGQVKFVRRRPGGGETDGTASA